MFFDFWEIGCIECELDQHSFEENAADRILADCPVLYLAHPIGGEAWNRGGLDEKLYVQGKTCSSPLPIKLREARLRRATKGLFFSHLIHLSLQRTSILYKILHCFCRFQAFSQNFYKHIVLFHIV